MFEKKNRNNNMSTITLHMPEALLEGLDQLVEKKMYRNRSEAIRTAVRDLLVFELGREWQVIVNENRRRS